ncbi:MAG: alanine--tRNA ligase, partial [candidate division Zixibacteria bacterium]|nr:alanine--tRNA ligase [candidate division Zixibacteria bacterium]
HFESLVSIAAGESRRHLTGVETFKLYDTYGFPADLTRLMAEERNMTVDMAGFEREMEQQRNRSRAGAATVDMSETAAPETRKISGTHSEFVGYDVFETEGAVVVTVLDTGVVLSRTPFYAESGGQIGDTGWLVSEEGAEYRIVDTVKRDGGILHKLDPQDMRPLLPGTQVAARIDTERRRAIMRNHTATHLLHAALRNVLGTHVHQRGSEVADDRLRFDFTHFSSVAPEELDTVERTVNENIWANAQVQWFETDLEEARNMGAMALFTEKYGDRVRVVRIGDVSLELCGGSHLRATGEIGLFRIVRESGIAAGERRIEALTGEAAYRAIKHDTRTLDEVAALLKTDPGEVTRRAGALNDRIRELEREVRRLQSESARNWLDDILAKTVMIGDITVAASRVDCPDTDALRAMGDAVRARLPGEAVGALFSVIGERPVCIAVVTDAGISNRGLHAGTLARDIAAIMGGGGGGKAHMAQAGGKDISSMDAALSRVPEVVSTHLQQG